MRRGAFLVAAMLFTSTEAQAFCRTTTCDPHTMACERNDDGCVRDGTPLTWTELPIVYRFSSQGSSKLDTDAAKDAIRAAFTRWSSVMCGSERTSLRFVEGAAVKKRQTFGIYFRDDQWTHEDADETLALTNVKFGETYGDIQYVDMEVNTAEHAFSIDGADGVDLEAVITHEVGHYIGLAHSNVDASIMAPRYCQSGDRCGGDREKARDLSLDDMDAVCTLYPPNGISGVHYVDAADGGCSAAPGRASSAWPLALALLAVCRRRRGIVAACRIG
jgi:hypothetical protein